LLSKHLVSWVQRSRLQRTRNSRDGWMSSFKGEQLSRSGLLLNMIKTFAYKAVALNEIGCIALAGSISRHREPELTGKRQRRFGEWNCMGIAILPIHRSPPAPNAVLFPNAVAMHAVSIRSWSKPNTTMWGEETSNTALWALFPVLYPSNSNANNDPSRILRMIVSLNIQDTHCF